MILFFLQEMLPSGMSLSLDFKSTAPVTALRLEVLPDDRLPERGPGRCYYEGRKGDFFPK